MSLRIGKGLSNQLRNRIQEGQERILPSSAREALQVTGTLIVVGNHHMQLRHGAGSRSA